MCCGEEGQETRRWIGEVRDMVAVVLQGVRACKTGEVLAETIAAMMIGGQRKQVACVIQHQTGSCTSYCTVHSYTLRSLLTSVSILVLQFVCSIPGLATSFGLYVSFLPPFNASATPRQPHPHLTPRASTANPCFKNMTTRPISKPPFSRPLPATPTWLSAHSTLKWH